MCRLYIIILALTLTFLLLACEKPAVPDTDVAPPADAAAEAGSQIFSGVITEVIEVDNYTYMKIESELGSTWIATNLMWVNEGDKVAFPAGGVMLNYHSSTLDRTFESIMFVDEITVTESGTHVNADAARASGMAAPASAGAPVEQAANSDVQSIAGVFAAYPGIDGQPVSLNAKVLKFSANIMGSNWVTLQDGTGEPPNDVLVVRTSETARIGDKVTVAGTAKIDVSLGHGYDYKVLLVDARFSP